MRCVVSLFFRWPCYLHLSLLYLSLFHIPPLHPQKAVILSPSLTVGLMSDPSTGLLCFARDITSLFLVLSLHSSCHLSVAAVLSEGYLAAISGSIFALSFGLSQRCCPCVIVCHYQGGDLFLWQHLKMLPGMSL